MYRYNDHSFWSQTQRICQSCIQHVPGLCNSRPQVSPKTAAAALGITVESHTGSHEFAVCTVIVLCCVIMFSRGSASPKC